jgi:hypothetical protein
LAPTRGEYASTPTPFARIGKCGRFGAAPLILLLVCAAPVMWLLLNAVADAVTALECAAAARPSSAEFQFNCEAAAAPVAAPAFRNEAAGSAGAPRSAPEANTKVRCGGGRGTVAADDDAAEAGVDAADVDDADEADNVNADSADDDAAAPVFGGEIGGANGLNGTLNDAAEDGDAAAGGDRSTLDGLSADFGSDATALASRGAQTGASAVAIRFGRNVMR